MIAYDDSPDSCSIDSELSPLDEELYTIESEIDPAEHVERIIRGGLASFEARKLKRVTVSPEHKHHHLLTLSNRG